MFVGLLLGKLTLIFMFFVMSNRVYFSLEMNNNPLHIIVPIFGISGLLVGSIFFKHTMKMMERKESMSVKLLGYKTAFIVKVAFIEGTVLLSMIGFLLSDNLYFTVVAAIMLCIFTAQWPTSSKIKASLKIDSNEA